MADHGKVTAADGADAFYTLSNNETRSEGLEFARERDRQVLSTWLGHPYIDVIDNSTSFKLKLQRMVQAVCRRVGIVEGSLPLATRKVRFVIRHAPKVFFPLRLRRVVFAREHAFTAS